MKKFGVIIFSLVLGSAITIAVIYALSPNLRKSPVEMEYIPESTARNVLYTKDTKGNIVPLDFTEISRKVMDAVVNIQSTQERSYSQGNQPQSPRGFEEEFFRYFFGPERMPEGQGRQRTPRPQMGIGSGVIINKDGYIVTNNHVVANSSELDITLHDNRSYKAEVVGTDPATDLALIRIKESNLPAIPLANSNEAQIGEWVLAVGNPYGLTSTVTAGIISAKSRALNIISDQYAVESFIQTDAAINPGNSGGALVNLQGGLIGINTAIASPTGSYSGYGFAISSNMVNKVVQDLIKYGEVRRGYLGIVLHNLTGKFARDNNIKINQGAYVDSALADGAAAKAGIRSGDVIVAVDGIDIRQSSELQEIIASQSPGDNVKVTINRKGETKQFKVTLKGRESDKKTAANQREKTDGQLETILGATFKTIEKEKAKSLGLEGGVQVTNIQQGKISSQTEMKEGFIITRVNDIPVRTTADLENIIQKRKGGGVMMEGVYENIKGTFYYAFGL
jgi:Do/DeqQ family serine protease